MTRSLRANEDCPPTSLPNRFLNGFSGQGVLYLKRLKRQMPDSMQSGPAQGRPGGMTAAWLNLNNEVNEL